MPPVASVLQELLVILDPILRSLGIPSEAASLHLMGMFHEAGACARPRREDVEGRSYPFRAGDLRDVDRPNVIETPLGVARFIHDLVSREYEIRTILDPCACRGALTVPWVGCEVISFEVRRGSDFFAFGGRIDCDLVIANPPFNRRGKGRKEFLPAKFLRHVLEVVPRGTPIVLITPMGMRLNQTKGSRRWRWLRDHAPPITGIISLPLDVFDGIKFHTEILLFGLPKLRPHYFLPDEYLRGLGETNPPFKQGQPGDG